MSKDINHYEWLDQHIEEIMFKAGVDSGVYNRGMVSAHGDKCYSYRRLWEEHGIPFHHGVAVYLLGRCKPYKNETSSDGGLSYYGIDKWVVANYHRFKNMMPN